VDVGGTGVGVDVGGTGVGVEVGGTWVSVGAIFSVAAKATAEVRVGVTMISTAAVVGEGVAVGVTGVLVGREV
jgi:hypothetical protein